MPEEFKSSTRRVRRPNNKKGRRGNTTHRIQMYNKLFSALSQGVPRMNKYVPDNQVYRMTQTVEATAILVTSLTLQTFFGRSFQLAFIDQAASWEAIFDQYKIEMIEYILLPRINSADGTVSNTGMVTTVIDYDDANNLTTVAQALDYTNAITGTGTSGHYRCLRPHVADAVYSGAFTSFGNASNEWVDCASATVQHFGVKGASTVTSAILTYDEIVRYHIAFRNVR